MHLVCSATFSFLQDFLSLSLLFLGSGNQHYNQQEVGQHRGSSRHVFLLPISMHWGQFSQLPSLSLSYSI